MMSKILTIAGSDSGGGAGIQADLKTIQGHGMYGMSAVTAVTAQNTEGVFRVDAVPAEGVRAQLEAVFSDLMPDAVKIGMVYNAQTVRVIAEELKKYRPAHVVIDTPMISSSGQPLLKEDALEAFTEELLPLAEVITPNVPEAEFLCRRIAGSGDLEAVGKADCAEAFRGGMAEEKPSFPGGENGLLQNENPGARPGEAGGSGTDSASAVEAFNGRIRNEQDMEQAARLLHEKFGCAVLVKGGHLSGKKADDCLLTKDGEIFHFDAPMIPGARTHGTGCTLSSSIACLLAEGCSLPKAAEGAKAYLREAIAHSQSLKKVPEVCGSADIKEKEGPAIQRPAPEASAEKKAAADSQAGEKNGAVSAGKEAAAGSHAGEKNKALSAGRIPVFQGWNLARTDRTPEEDLGRIEAAWKSKGLLIFDFDGTLIDSMGMWNHVGPDYLLLRGITPPEDLTQTIFQLTVDQCYDYFVQTFALDQTIDEYHRDIYAMIEDKYRHELCLKPGALRFLCQVKEAGKTLCILTNTARRFVEPAMARLGVDRYISPDFLYTCQELKLNKQTPEIYRAAAEKMGYPPEDSICFEDSSFAAKNARLAGCAVCGVYDPTSDTESDREIFAEYALSRIRNLWELTE